MKHFAYIPPTHRKHLFELSKETGQAGRSFDEVLIELEIMRLKLSNEDLKDLKLVWRRSRWPEAAEQWPELYAADFRLRADVMDYTIENKDIAIVEEAATEQEAFDTATVLAEEYKGREFYIHKRGRPLAVIWWENSQFQIRNLSKPIEARVCGLVYRSAITDEEKKLKFNEIANLQEGEAESIVYKLRQLLGSGVIVEVLTDVGDLINRMTKIGYYKTAGYDRVRRKVTTGLAFLSSEEAFEEDLLENVRHNVHIKVDSKDPVDIIKDLLKQYADAHAKLPTYNKVQRLAQQAAVSLGRLKIGEARVALENLKRYLADQETWVDAAHEYEGAQ